VKKFIIGLVIGFLVGSINVHAFRIAKPYSFTLHQDQLNLMNKSFEDIWNLSNGEFNFDIVSTTKGSPNNGDAWIFNDGGVYKWQYRANGTTHTITPD
jgi:hypothetical protein